MTHRALIVALLASLTVSLVVAAAPAAEVEPNNEPEVANELLPSQEMTGSIDPVRDVDTYELAGVNSAWGVIALLDTSDASESPRAHLTVLDHDGTTSLQSDVGSWERGSGIALQPFTDWRTPLYLQVREEGDDATTDPYVLRYVETVVSTQPESEPNETRATGTPSSFTHQGAIASTDDRDCFAFHGRTGDEIIVALDAGSGPLDAIVELVDLDDNILTSVDITGAGGSEFVVYDELPDEGVYAYCVAPAPSSATGAPAAYRVGLVRNGVLCLPSWEQGITWQNRPPEGLARPGETLEFRLAVTNTSPLTIPGSIDLGLIYPAACFSLHGAQPPPTAASAGSVSWLGQKVDLSPGEVYSTTAHLRAEAACVEEVSLSLGLPYYVTGSASRAPVAVYDRFVHLPMTLRTTP